MPLVPARMSLQYPPETNRPRLARRRVRRLLPQIAPPQCNIDPAVPGPSAAPMLAYIFAVDDDAAPRLHDHGLEFGRRIPVGQPVHMQPFQQRQVARHARANRGQGALAGGLEGAAEADDHGSQVREGLGEPQGPRVQDIVFPLVRRDPPLTVQGQCQVLDERDVPLVSLVAEQADRRRVDEVEPILPV